MRVAAPGKLVVTGAYAVLEGAPAIVCAVDRFAYAEDREGPPIAEGDRAWRSTREVQAAYENGRAPSIDTSELEDAGTKLGLGSSAAALVAALGLGRAKAGEDLASDAVRDAIFERARDVHARVQGGGSGVDVAASTFGGVLSYTLTSYARVTLPPGVRISAFFSGTSARTSTLRERVDSLRTRDAHEHAIRMARLAEIAVAADTAVRTSNARAFVDAVAATGVGLAALGVAADAPIVPAAFADLAVRAKNEGSAFIPSGAGGGDVGVWVGMSEPSASFKKAADDAGMKHLGLAPTARGVHAIQ